MNDHPQASEADGKRAPVQDRESAWAVEREALNRRIAELNRELARVHSLLNATLESTTDGILVIGEHDEVVSCNLRFVELWRLPPDQIVIGQADRVLPLVAEQLRDSGAFLAKVRELYARPELESHDVLELKDGRVFERDSRPQRLDGQCVGRVFSFRDVTERRRVEERAAHEQARLKFIFESVPVGIASHIVYADGRTGRAINDAHLRICGLTREQHEIPDIYTKLTQPEDHARQREFIRRVQAGDINQYSMEKRYLRLDGTVVWVAFTYLRQTYADGSYEELTTVVDITALKRAQAEAAHEQERLKFVFETVPVGIALNRTGADGRSERIINNAHLRICGLTREQDRQLETYQNLNHPEDRVRQQKFTARLESGEINQYAMKKRYLRLDGTVVWVVFSMQRRKFPDGSFEDLTTVVDITDIKQAEARLQDIHQELVETSRQAGMAEVATSVLHNIGNVLNSVNVSATLVADEVKKSKIPYVGKVVALLNEHAGDLGAFLTADSRGRQVPGYLGQLAEQLGREQQAALKELELLRQNLDHIKDIVAMQQNYGKISGLTEVVRVADLIEDALVINAAALTRQEIEVVREYAGVPDITVEKHKVLQILVNLVSNAGHACAGSGRPDKQIGLRVAPSGGGVQIAVLDNGVGIPPENLGRIFQHGFTTRKGGHGFGLHNGALTARELGGSLTVQSGGPGQGAVFTLELPLEPAAKPGASSGSGS